VTADGEPDRTRMQKVVMYTTPICPYCVRAKRLLQQKKVPFHEIDVSRDPSLRARMVQLAGGMMTVPKIFIGDTHIGGSDELYELERSGRLDPLLNGAPGA
jgi:glutaredoxin 3